MSAGGDGVKLSSTFLLSAFLNSIVWFGKEPPCCVSKCHSTLVGPLTVIRPLSVIGCTGPMQPGKLISFGSTCTLRSVIEANGGFITGRLARLPAVSVTLLDTQQGLPGSSGVVTSHQVVSLFLP